MAAGYSPGTARQQGSRLLENADVIADIKRRQAALEGRNDYSFRMDDEGSEAETIRGMDRILTSQNRPSGAFIEIHSALLQQSGNSARLFVEIFSDLGYRVKMARYRGRNDVAANSSEELLSHPLLEHGYWETFFKRQDAWVARPWSGRKNHAGLFHAGLSG